MMQELDASSKGLREALQQSGGKSPLMQAMLEETGRQLSDQEKKDLLADAQASAWNKMEEMKGLTPEQQKQKMVAELKEAVALVASKGSPEDVRHYKDVLLDVAQRTAEAAKEGGFLGIGGVAVSDQEKAMLDLIRQAIG